MRDRKLSNHDACHDGPWRFVIRTARFVRPHALLGASAGLVAQFRCGLWGWLVNVHSRRGARLCRSPHRSSSGQ